MIYLYIPFSNEEHNEQLLKIAENWCHDVYEKNSIPCQILSNEKKINNFGLNLNHEKIKIYILSYDTESKTISSSSKQAHSITIDELAHRLLSLGLPSQGVIEIKLCIKCQKESNELITDELLKQSLLNLKYDNPNLVVRTQYSHEPFPGECKKLAYRTLSGTVDLFFKEGSNPIDEPSNIAFNII